MMRLNVSSGHPLEPVLGYSRAVRVGPHVAVTGTAAVDEDGRAFGVGDAGAQARRIFEIIERALVETGASFEDVVRTRVLLVDIADWEAVGRVHGEVFGAIRPATTVMQVSRFIDPEWLVEIEVDAIVSTDS